MRVAEGGGTVAYQVNQHVKRLAAYQPFDANFGQLYAEYVDTRQSDQLETRAFDFVLELVGRPTTRLVILTGDAGHGKTHLCGRLLTAMDEAIDDPRAHLKAYGTDGSSPLARTPDGRGLHIVKDLSELDPDRAVRALLVGLGSTDRVTVVCANEGKLRAVLNNGPPDIEPLRDALDGVLTSGRTSVVEHVHVIDMNHQSVAAPGGRSLVAQAINSWATDGRKWSSCELCDARDECPIYENHRLLAADDERGASRRAGAEVLLRIIEQTGHVVTIRELLIFVAHAITGGLRCTDVHEKARRGKRGWQSNYMFHQVMFGTQLNSGEIEGIRVFSAADKLDPGERAIRPVDDTLDHDRRDDSTAVFTPDIDLGGKPAPKNHQQARRDSQDRRRLYAFLRRRSYFDTRSGPEQPAIPFAERLGLRYYDEFERIITGDLEPTDLKPIRDRILVGLEAVQGARRGSGSGSFLVVDSAFASHRGSASVVARKITAGSVELLPQDEWWALVTGSEPDLERAVDWLHRRIYILLDNSNGNDSAPLAIDLDCRQFEFVRRAAQGLTSRSFFQADIRRIMAQLADLAEGAVATDEISVLVNGRTSHLVIDLGDVIQATGP